MDSVGPFHLVANVFYSYFQGPDASFPLNKIMANNYNGHDGGFGFIAKIGEMLSALYS